jgi:hypothetical protein
MKFNELMHADCLAQSVLHISGCYFQTFCVCMVLELELRAYTTSHSTSPSGVRYFQDRVLNYLPRLASNHDPPDLCLLGS